MINVVSSKMVKKNAIEILVANVHSNTSKLVSIEIPAWRAILPCIKPFPDKIPIFETVPGHLKTVPPTLLIWFSPIFMIEKLGKLEIFELSKTSVCGLIICTLRSKLYSHWRTCSLTVEIHDCYENG